MDRFEDKIQTGHCNVQRKHHENQWRWMKGASCEEILEGKSQKYVPAKVRQLKWQLRHSPGFGNKVPWSLYEVWDRNETFLWQLCKILKIRKVNDKKWNKNSWDRSFKGKTKSEGTATKVIRFRSLCSLTFPMSISVLRYFISLCQWYIRMGFTRSHSLSSRFTLHCTPLSLLLVLFSSQVALLYIDASCLAPVYVNIKQLHVLLKAWPQNTRDSCKLSLIRVTYRRMSDGLVATV